MFKTNVFFCADDYGLTEKSSEVIEALAKEGFLYKVSVFVNSQLSDYKNKLQKLNAQKALHLNFVEGKCCSDPKEVPLLVNEKGIFCHTFVGLLKLSLTKPKELKKEIALEIRSQLKAYRELVGEDEPLFLDSHQHTHMIPAIFHTLLKVLREDRVSVRYLRIPAEPFSPFLLCPSLYSTYSIVGMIKQVLLKFLFLFNRRALKKSGIPTGLFCGILFSGRMDRKRIEKVVTRFRPLMKKRDLPVEFLFHPGYTQGDDPALDAETIQFPHFYKNEGRALEFHTVHSLCTKHNISFQKEGYFMPYLEKEKVDERTRIRLEAILEKSYGNYWKKKRTFDVFFALLILTFFLPLMALIALVIWIDDPSASPFFKQIRVGRHGKEFYMYKFRTMRPNSDKLKKDLAEQNEMDGPVFKMKDDPRITRVGKFLRKCSLDELMQFFNVLRGDMSLVGPRPPLPGEVEFYSDYQKLRLLVTPGLTCTWQISKNRNDIPFEEWVEMDLDYILHRSTKGDIAIMLKTPVVMISATGR